MSLSHPIDPNRPVIIHQPSLSSAVRSPHPGRRASAWLLGLALAVTLLGPGLPAGAQALPDAAPGLPPTSAEPVTADPNPGSEEGLPEAARRTLAPGSSTILEVWARVTFAETGQLEQLQLADEADHPEAFVQEVKRQLAAARIRPPQEAGRPARLQTGVRLRYAIRVGEQAGRLRLLDLAIRPLPLERRAPPLPQEIRRTQGWTGQIKGICTVDPQGQCAEVEIEALPGMPESLRRWVRLTMTQWRFEPQRLNDQAMPGEFEHTFSIRVGQTRPEDFRVPKFDRIEQQRR